MAARRLLIVLVLLLAASIVAAALAPERRGSGLLDDTGSSESTTTTTAVEPAGESIAARIEATPKDPETVRASPGDQLALAVGVPGEPGRTIAIDDFGMTEFATPKAPARFYLLLRDPGEYAITDEQDEVVGRIAVDAPAPGGSSEPAGREGDRGP